MARLSGAVGDSEGGRFAEMRPGYGSRTRVHVDSCELCSATGKAHLFLAVDRVTKLTYVELHDQADMMAGAAFL